MAEVSIIIPCYNCADWIEKCLFSLEKQTFIDFEVICIDDYSTDDTKQVIEKVIDKCSKNIYLVSNTHNYGPAYSRNKGIELAQGKYVAFCDSDDWYEKDFVERMYSTLVKNDADLVMCEYRKVYDSEKTSEDIHYLKDLINNSKSDYIACSKASMCLLMFKKSIIGELKIPNLRNGEDIAYVPCIESKAAKIAVLPEVLYNYRMREGSASKKPDPSVFMSLQKAFEYIETNVSDTVSCEVVEYIGIRTILYGATINAIKAKIDKTTVCDMIKCFCDKYPNWKKNRYLFLLSKPKRLYVELSANMWIGLCKCLTYIHSKLSV